MSDLIVYTIEDGKSQIQIRTEQDTVWLTQLEMAELFSATKQNSSLHLKNLFEDGELSEDSFVKECLTTAADGAAPTTEESLVVHTMPRVHFSMPRWGKLISHFKFLTFHFVP